MLAKFWIVVSLVPGFHETVGDIRCCTEFEFLDDRIVVTTTRCFAARGGPAVFANDASEVCEREFVCAVDLVTRRFASRSRRNSAVGEFVTNARSKKLQRVDEAHAVVLHHEVVGVAVFAACEAVVERRPLVRDDCERWLAVRMEGAQSDPLTTLEFEAHRLTNQLHEIGAFEHAIAIGAAIVRIKLWREVNQEKEERERGWRVCGSTKNKNGRQISGSQDMKMGSSDLLVRHTEKLGLLALHTEFIRSEGEKFANDFYRRNNSTARENEKFTENADTLDRRQKHRRLGSQSAEGLFGPTMRCNERRSLCTMGR